MIRALALAPRRGSWSATSSCCATALLLPLGLGALIASDGTDGSWGDVVAMQFVMVLLFCVYATATTSLAARRRQLVLKRLRSGELSDAADPRRPARAAVVARAVQSVLLITCAVAFGAPLPERPLACSSRPTCSGA